MDSDVSSLSRLRLLEDIENISIDKFANYDVFISYNGPNIKTGFVSFLYKDLIAAGLRPFPGYKSIDVGEDCWECVEHAIKKTPVAVVIFSGSFTQSEWCMRELDVMLHSPGTTVLPIFYDVRASEVRFPESGQLKDGFEKLSGLHDKAAIDGWRADLEQASKLRGWEHVGAHKRLEADLVMEVVGTIVKLAKKALPLVIGEHVGVNRVAEEIIHKLDNKKEVLVLGLWGMGGIGKSTLAKELYNQLSKRFRSACYIEDVTEKVIQGGVVKVQNHIMKNLCKRESIEIEGKLEGKRILEERLCRKRILMVLDDVRESDEMEYWISRKMLKEGSMCIVTSRNRRVFEASNSFAINHEVYIHDVQLLSSVDSERVFTSHAFGGYENVRPELEKMVTGISKACGGVPLVLKVFGALLKNEDNVNVWKEVMEKLNCGGLMDDKKIFDCLWISYDDLTEEQQEMFLDIACGLIGESKDSAVCVWRSLQWSAELGVWNLTEKALITVDDDDCLRMHDHLRDMGREIVKKRRASEGVIRRLWMPESLKLLKENEQLPDSLQTLILFDNDDYGSSNDVIDLDLSHMTELRILILTSVINVVSSFPRYLRWLDQVINYDIHKNIAIVPFTPKNNLVILKFQGFKIQSLPESIGDLTNLEVLNLRSCMSLTMLPKSFGGLKSVQNLNLEGCGIQSLPESFGDLTNLEVLNLGWCKSLTVLPKSFGGLKSVQNLDLHDCEIQSLGESFGDLTNLEVLNLGWCKSLTVLPKSFGGLKSVRNLKLEGCGIQSLPESFGDLTNLEVLNLGECKSLTMLPKSFGGLKSVQNLDLHDCGIQSLPESFGDLTNLEVLNLGWCKSLTMLPKSFGGLKSVLNLDLHNCGIQSLPESFGDLTNLEVLNLGWCKSLTVLPKSFGGLKSVWILKLEGCGIQSLGESFGDLINLEVLNLRRCESLTMLPKAFGGLKSVQNLDLHNCGIQSLPESFGDLTNLEVLNLGWCKSLAMLPKSFGGLKSVQNLELHDCGIQSLGESFGDLTNLEVLNLGWCKSLTILPKSFGGLKSVQNLELHDCGIQSLPESFGDLINLEVLNLGRCKSLTVLPKTFGGLKSVRNLKLEGCGIQSLPESFEDLTNLEVLNLGWCKSLTMLPKSFGSLKSVQNLDLHDCEIQNLGESFGDLTNLEVLNLDWCESLTVLPKSFGGLKSVRNLKLEGCGIQSLPESFEDLTNLEVLNLGWCKSLTMLPKSFGSLKSVRNLNLEGCGIQSLPESFGDLTNLEVLNLGGCKSLTMLPKSFGSLKSVRNLNLEGCGIQSLGESFGDLTNLEVLNLGKCKSLTMLPKSFGGLKSVRNLNLEGCGIQSLPKSFGDLTNLEVLNLRWCKSLSMLPRSLGGLNSEQNLGESKMSPVGNCDHSQDDLNLSIQLRMHDLQIGAINVEENQYESFVGGESQTYHSSSCTSNNSFSDALDNELQKIDNISEVSSNHEDLQSLLDVESLQHEDGIITFCCYDATNIHFEFYFRDAKDMACVAGVGLQYAKVVLVDGWKITVQELSEMQWKQTLGRVRSSSSIVYKSLKLKQSPMLCADVTMSQDFKGYPLLWTLAKYFTLKEALTKFTTANNNDASTSEGISGAGITQANGNDNENDILSRLFGMWSRSRGKGKEKMEEDEDGENEDNGGDPRDEKDGIDKNRDATVSIQLLAGGEIENAKVILLGENEEEKECYTTLEALTYEMDAKQRLGVLDKTIRPDLKFVFYIEDGIKLIQCTVGNINFILDTKEKWLHHGLRVAFGLYGDYTNYGEVVRSSTKHLDVREGRKGGKGTRTFAGSEGNVEGTTSDCTIKPLGIGGAGGFTKTTSWNVTDTRANESSFEYSGDYTSGGLEFKAITDPDDHVIEYRYSSRDHRSYEDLPPTAPLRMNQDVKFQTTFEVFEDTSQLADNFVEYKLTASRCLEEVKSPEITLENLNARLFHPGKHEKLLIIYNQRYEKRVLLNHGMTHLDGRHHKLYEREISGRKIFAAGRRKPEYEWTCKLGTKVDPLAKPSSSEAPRARASSNVDVDM